MTVCTVALAFAETKAVVLGCLTTVWFDAGALIACTLTGLIGCDKEMFIVTLAAVVLVTYLTACCFTEVELVALLLCWANECTEWSLLLSESKSSALIFFFA